MIDNLAFMLPIFVFAAAIVKRTEMAIWLSIIMMFSLVIEASGSPHSHMLIFFTGANLILMTVAFTCWRISKQTLPMLIGVIACFDVVASFTHLIVLLNSDSLSYVLGIASGITAYAKLVLILVLKDGKGVLNELFDDIRGFVLRGVRIRGHRNNGRLNK